MKTPDIPRDEEYRLQALRSLDLLDTAPDADFDAIVRLGRQLFDVPICLVSLVDADRQWFKARDGLDAEESPRAVSFCAHAILAPEVFVVPDALADERFRDNPFVTGEPRIRFYAGAPLRLPNGYTIGTVCIISPTPRPAFPPEAAARLEDLAGLAVAAIGVRALRRELDDERDRRQRLLRALDVMPQPAALLDAEGHVVTANAAFAGICHGYPAPGAAIHELLPVDPAVLAAAASSPEEARTLSVPAGPVTLRLTLQPDPDGFIVTGAA